MNQIKKRYVLFFICFSLMFNLIGCGAKKAASKEKKLTIYADIKDKHSQNILNTILESYKKDNSDVKITLNAPVGSTVTQDIGKMKDIDIIIIPRNKMIELIKGGYLSELGQYYEKNSISDRFNNVISFYGRYSDKYYGIPLSAYSIELIYNSDMLKKNANGVPLTINDIKGTLKGLNSSSARIPVILTDDIDINNAVGSLVASNTVSIQTLGTIYDDSEIGYKSDKEMQNMFDAIAALVKDGTLNRNTLELGSEGSIQKFIKGEIPIIVCISYYAKEFKNTAFTAVSDYTMPSGAQGNIPIICNAIMCVPISSKNGQQIEDFIKYALEDKTQKMLSAKGFITANKKANVNLKGVSGVASWHIQNAGENSIVYLYNLPEKFKEPLYAKIQTLLSGKHTKNEWEEIIDEIYKK